MANLQGNNYMYSVANESELAVVLSHYSSEFVFSVMEDAVTRNQNEVAIVPMPNIVGAWEANFKVIYDNYGTEGSQEISRVREETYREIIGYICRKFQLNFTIDESVDLFSAAFTMYEFFVCGYTNNLITFFARYCYNQRESLYNDLGLAEQKKNKDSSTIYGKKRYRDLKLAVINANVDWVVTQICQMDIRLDSIAKTVIDNDDTFRYLMSICSDAGDYFTNFYARMMLHSAVQPALITSIRFKLQEIAMVHDQIMPPNSEEVTDE